MCKICPSDWCRESCEKLQEDYPTCRCPDWPEHKKTYSAADLPPVTGCVAEMYTLTLGKHCGGGTLRPLMDGRNGVIAEYGWDPEAAGKKECEARCLQSPKCGGFVWRDENPRPSGGTPGCFWKAQPYGARDMEYHDCYELTNGPCGFAVHKGKHCGGSNTGVPDVPYGWQPEGETIAAKIEACEQKCNEAENCAAFVWRYDTDRGPEGCFWKAGPLNLNANDNHDCYVKPGGAEGDVRSLLDQGGHMPILNGKER